MIDRYKTKEIHYIWDRGGEIERLEKASWAAAQASGGEELANAVKFELDSRDTDEIDSEWTKLEHRFDHDIAAWVAMVRSWLPDEFRDRWHHGRTSSDLVETALALGVKHSMELVGNASDNLALYLAEKAERYRDNVVLGRTHGQDAEPTSIGRRFALHAYAVSRCGWGESYGSAKMSGPVGTHPTDDGNAALAILGLSAVPSTQIVPRWHLAGSMLSLIRLSMVLSELATDIRLGSRSGGGWVREGHSRSEQRGSSSMPQKRNPIKSERAVGLCRKIRTDAMSVVEAGTELWEERDISHSSVERIAIPDVFHLTHFVLQDLARTVSSLEVDTEWAYVDADRATGEPALQALIRVGYSYEDAYEQVRSRGPSVAGPVRAPRYDWTVERQLWRGIDLLLEGKRWR